MHSIKSAQYGRVWHSLCVTTSNSPSWGFDRLRLYYPTNDTYVTAFPMRSDSNFNLPQHSLFNGHFQTSFQGDRGVALRAPYKYITSPQRFSSTNGYEHTFSLDLSWNTNNEYVVIGITGVPLDAYVQQVYATPTGFSATTGKNAQLESYMFFPMIMQENVGGATTSIKMAGQNLNRLYTRGGVLGAKSIEIQNTLLDRYTLANVMQEAVNIGILNGYLNYTGSKGHNEWTAGTSGGYNAQLNYDTLISRGWQIIGIRPPNNG